MADRVVDEDAHQLQESRRIALDRRGLGVDQEPDLLRCRGLDEGRGSVGRDATDVDWPPLQGDRARIRAGQQEQVLDQRGQVLDLGIDVVDGLDEGLDWLGAMPSQMSTELRMTVRGVRSSWLASAANSRWRRSAARWLASELRIGTSARRA